MRVTAFSPARTPMRFNSLGAGSTVRESDTGNLDDLQDLLGSQLVAPLHRKLERTVKTGQTQVTLAPPSRRIPSTPSETLRMVVDGPRGEANRFWRMRQATPATGRRESGAQI